jgi:hypothetical protein
MGYRSDVALGIAFPNKAALTAFASAQLVTGTMEMQEAIKQFGVTHMSAGYGESVVLWVGMEQVKWYPEYPSVIAFNQIVQNAQNLGYPTIEIEIGEEVNDVTFAFTDGNKANGGVLYECFNIRREIIQPNTSEDISSFVKEN